MKQDPRTRDDISAALAAAENEVAAFFTSLSADELSRRVASAWTAFEQLEHLTSAVGAVARGFAAPKLLLRLRFGRAKQPGRSYLELRDDYRARLAAMIWLNGGTVASSGRDETPPYFRPDEARLIASMTSLPASSIAFSSAASNDGPLSDPAVAPIITCCIT